MQENNTSSQVNAANVTMTDHAYGQQQSYQSGRPQLNSTYQNVSRINQNPTLPKTKQNSAPSISIHQPVQRRVDREAIPLPDSVKERMVRDALENQQTGAHTSNTVQKQFDYYNTMQSTANEKPNAFSFSSLVLFAAKLILMYLISVLL